MSVSFLRRIHWGIVLLCFFLPAVQGCNKEIIYPYLELFKPDSWLQTAIYLYPLALALLVGLIVKLVPSEKRFAAAWSIGYLFFLALSFLLLNVIREMPGWYCALLVMFWGIIAFGLLKSREEGRVIDLMGFLLSGLALWCFPLAFLFREKILYGGWIYIYAHGFIILSYLIEWMCRRKMTGCLVR